MAASGQTPKTMSSRLMGMKFMQRSAASPTNSTPSDTPSAKRSKLNSGSPHVRRAAEQEAFQEVQAQEDAKREAILDKLAEEAGDTKWVLKTSAKTKPSLSIVNAGYGAIDRNVAIGKEFEGDEGYGDDEKNHAVEHGVAQDFFDGGGIAGRKSFGKFNRHIEKEHNSQLTSSSDDEDEDDDESDSGSSNDEGNDNDGPDSSVLKQSDKSIGRKSSIIAEDLRAKKKAKRKEERKLSREQAERRRSKEVKLNRHMTSISSGGSKNKANRGPQACFNCGNESHMAADCPEQKRHKKYKRYST